MIQLPFWGVMVLAAQLVEKAQEIRAAVMQAEIRICQSFIDRQYRDPVFIAQSHFPVVEAIMRRDADAAEGALRVHLDDAHAKAHAHLIDEEIMPPPPSPRHRIAKP